MSNLKHESCKQKKSISKSILAIALIFVILLIAKNLYSVQTASLTNVEKSKYLLADNQQPSQGKVFVNYLDGQGKVLSPREEHTGNVGEVYSFSRKKIEGYRSTGIDPVNKIGNYDEKDINVNFIYESRIEDVNTTTDGDTVNVQVVKNKDVESQEINMSIITKNKDGEILKLGKYIVTNSSQNVLRNSTSYVDKLIVGSLNINNEGTDNYFIQQVKAPDGYKTLSEKIKVSVVKTLNPDTDKNEVSASVSNEDLASVSIENGEIIVTIVNEEGEDPTPTPTPIPDEPTPTPTTAKIFDLEMHKTISKAVLTLDGKESVIEKKGDSLVKIDIPKSKLPGASVKVYYTLEVKNVGEIAGYALEIKDVIPDGMKLVPNDKWSVDNNYAISNALENVRLEPGDSATLEVVFDWELTEENIGLKTNEAGISVYYNEEGIKDNTPDNNDKDSILITIKTGKVAIITGEIVLALIIVGGLVYVVKKKV